MPWRRTGSPSPTSSILITSAPMSARNMEQKGPDRILDRSTTRMPESCISSSGGERDRASALFELRQQGGLARPRGVDVAALDVAVAADRRRHVRDFDRQREIVRPQVE